MPPTLKKNEILPIPELLAESKPKTPYFIVIDLRTRRLARIKKETFGKLLKTAGIPSWYFCRWSFATWTVLLPSEELAVKLAGSNVWTRFFRLQQEYQGKRRIKVTVCNVPVSRKATTHSTTAVLHSHDQLNQHICMLNQHICIQ